MKLLLLLALLIPGVALAQAASAPLQPTCLPNTNLINGTGTDYREFETADMVGEVGWCPSTGGAGWHIVTHRWCLRTECDKAPLDAWSKVVAAINRISVAPSPIAQLGLEWKASGKPLKTPLEIWLFMDWRYQACLWLTSTQPGVSPRPPLPLMPVGGMVMPVLTYCDNWNPGPKPITPPPTQDIYVASQNSGQPTRQTFAATLVNGVWKRGAVDGTVAVGTVLDCTAIQIIELGGLARFCKVPDRNSVTGATKKP